MAGKLGTPIIGQPETISGMIKEPHLAFMWGKDPIKASDLTVHLLSSLSLGRNWDNFLSSLGTKTFESNEVFEWDIVGSSEDSVSLIEVRNYAESAVTTGNVGANGEPFYLVFAKDYFAKQYVIHGKYFEQFPIKILEEAQSEGQYFVYKCETFGADMEGGIPVDKVLKSGEKFVVGYEPVEAAFSQASGNLHFKRPVSTRNEFGSLRMSYKMPGNMHNKIVKMEIPLELNGKTSSTKVWTQAVDWEFMQEWSTMKSNYLWHGRSTKLANGNYSNIGASGEVIKSGDGLKRQMERGYVRTFNEFDIEALTECIDAVTFGKVNMHGANVIVKTGSLGAKLFHQSVSALTQGWSVKPNSDAGIQAYKKVSSNAHQNAYSAGFAFTEYMTPMGYTIKLIIDPSLDDTRYSLLKWKGYPAESAKFIICDLGLPGKDTNNIFKCAAKDSPEMTSYKWGPRNPFTGKMGNENMSHTEDSALIDKFIPAIGACVLDPTRCIIYQPSVLIA